MAKKKAKRKGKRITTKAVQSTEKQPVKLPQVAVTVESDESPWDEEGLTPRQLMFVVAYSGAAGGNAPRAAELAGYRSENLHSLHVMANRLMNEPNVIRAVATRLAKKLMELDANAIKAVLARIANSSLANFITVDDDGTPRLDFIKARDRAAMGQLKEFKAKGILDPAGIGADGKVVFRPFEVSIKTHDPRPATETLAKIAGLLKDMLDITSMGEQIKGYIGWNPSDWDAADPAKKLLPAAPVADRPAE